jgi:hypothetical protein
VLYTQHNVHSIIYHLFTSRCACQGSVVFPSRRGPDLGRLRSTAGTWETPVLGGGEMHKNIYMYMATTRQFMDAAGDRQWLAPAFRSGPVLAFSFGTLYCDCFEWLVLRCVLERALVLQCLLWLVSGWCSGVYLNVPWSYNACCGWCSGDELRRWLVFLRPDNRLAQPDGLNQIGLTRLA